MSQNVERSSAPAAIVLCGVGVLLLPVFVFAQTATSTPDFRKLIAQLQEQIRVLQTQVASLRSELETVKTELKFTKTLTRGVSGDEVKALQEFLKQQPDIYPEGLITGFFGSLTENAIKRFQKKHGIEAEGVVGPKTRAQLNNLIAEGSMAPFAASPRRPSLLQRKVTICHLPPGNTDNPHTIEIDQSALDVHLAHGDTRGACGIELPPPTPPPSPATTTPPGTIPSPPALPPLPTNATTTGGAPPPPPPASVITTPPASSTPPPPTVTVSGQTAPLWVRMLGSTDHDRALAIAADQNGYSYVAGYLSASLDGQPYRGGYDAFIAKYDPNGSRLWTRELGSTRSGLGSAFADAWTAVAVDSSGNVYLAGWSYGSLDGQPFSDNTDAILAKYDSNGTKLWVREFGSTLNDQLYGIAVDAAGNVYAAGLTDTFLDGQASAGLMDALVVKYDTNGNKLWTRLLGTSSYDRANAVALDYNVVYIGGWTRGPLGGEAYSGGGSEDAFLTAYDTNGTRLWTRLLGGSGSEVTYGVTVSSPHAVYIAGQTFSSLAGQSNAGGLDAMAALYDPTMQSLQWARQFGSPDQDNAYGVAADVYLNVYLTGSISGGLDGQANAGGTDAFVVKYDASGNRVWTRLLGTGTSDVSQAIALDSSGNVLIAGGSWGSLGGQANAGLEDAFLAKYSPSQITSIPPPSPTPPPPPPPPPPSVATSTTATPTPPPPATPPTTATSSCVALTITLVGGKTTYAQGESGAYQWTCDAGANVAIDLIKPDGTKQNWSTGSDPENRLSYQTISFGASNLAPGTYAIRATCLNCPTAITATVSFSVIASPPPADTTPPVISNLRAENIIYGRAQIKWTTDEPATDTVLWDTSSSGSFASTVGARCLSGTPTYVTDHCIDFTGLLPNAVYYYKVWSLDASNNRAESAALQFTSATYVPEAPTNLTAQAVSSGADFNKVELRWTPSCVNTPCISPETKVYRRLAGGAWDWAYIGSAGYNYTIFTDSHFPNGTYEYRIAVCNTYGCSPNSNIATVTVAATSTGTTATSTSSLAAPSALASLLSALAHTLQELQRFLGRMR